MVSVYCEIRTPAKVINQLSANRRVFCTKENDKYLPHWYHARQNLFIAHLDNLVGMHGQWSRLSVCEDQRLGHEKTIAESFLFSFVLSFSPNCSHAASIFSFVLLLQWEKRAQNRPNLALLFCPKPPRATETSWFMQTSSLRFLADIETFSGKKKTYDSKYVSAKQINSYCNQCQESHYSNLPLLTPFPLPPPIHAIVGKRNTLLARCGLVYNAETWRWEWQWSRGQWLKNMSVIACTGKGWSESLKDYFQSVLRSLSLFAV